MPVTKVNVELEDWVQRIIDETVARHINSCPNAERINRIELSLSRAIGMGVGAGAVGGLIVQIAGLMK
jgi:hypothetical protein